jgi:hypothetical protein
MAKKFKAFLKRLPKAQRELWPQLAPLASLGFVLHGGTAIALRLGHRDSLDFDFFTEYPLDRNRLVSAVPSLASAVALQDEPNAYTALIRVPDGEVKLSFFGGITFGRIGEPDLTNDRVAVLASLDDLMAQKLKVVMQRVEAKDYCDLAALLRAGLSLESGMGGAVALFGANFSAMECAKALIHFKGGDLATVPSRDKETLLKAVRSLRYEITPGIIRSRSLSPGFTDGTLNAEC